MLAEVGSKTRGDLVRSVNPERTGYGERGAGARIIERHQRAALHHLAIAPNVVDGGHATEGQAVVVQDALPLDPVARGEDGVEDTDQRASVGAPRGRGREARVGREVRSLE